MAASAHPAASDHLPWFLPGADQSDPLMTAAAVILLISVVAFGVLFLTLHTLPERMAHKAHKLQFEIVAVLGLLALFTHMHVFWVAGLLLALIDLPDFGGWFGKIAGSVEKIADNTSRTGVDGEAVADTEHSAETKLSPDAAAGKRRGDGAGSPTPERASAVMGGHDA
jgi:hypothetical protein